MADYRFETLWKVEAPIEDVWEAITHSERWSQSWRGVEQMTELESGVANLRRFVFRSRFRYPLVFEMRATRVEKPPRLEGAAGHRRARGDRHVGVASGR